MALIGKSAATRHTESRYLRQPVFICQIQALGTTISFNGILLPLCSFAGSKISFGSYHLAI